MTCQTALARFAGAAQRLFDAASGLVLAAITAVVLWGVFTRFALSAASWWTDEAARLLLLWLTMLGAAAAAGRAEHLGVDFVVRKLHPAAQRAISMAVEMVVIAFAMFILVYGGLKLVLVTAYAAQRTPAMGLPMGLVYLAAPIGGSGIALFSADRLVRLSTASRGEDCEVHD